MPQLANEQAEGFAQKMTEKAEHRENISKEMNNLPINERREIAKRMEEINAEHVDKDKSLPKLEITYGADQAGTEHVTDIKTPGRIMGSLSKDDLYDMPTGKGTGRVERDNDMRDEQLRNLQGDTNRATMYSY